MQYDGFVSRDELAKQDEDNGILEFRQIWNDGQEQNFIWLISCVTRGQTVHAVHCGFPILFRIIMARASASSRRSQPYCGGCFP